MKTTKTIKTTKKQFERFKKECLLYQKILGLMNYKLFFEHRPCEGEHVAEVFRNYDGAVATLRFNSDLPEEDYADLDIKQTAKHEMLHVLLDRLVVAAKSRYVRPDDIDDSEEHLVRVLEKLI